MAQDALYARLLIHRFDPVNPDGTMYFADRVAITPMLRAEARQE